MPTASRGGRPSPASPRLQERAELERQRQEAELGKLRADVAQDIAQGGGAAGAAGGAQAATQQQQRRGGEPEAGAPAPPVLPRGARVVLDGRKGASLASVDEGGDEDALGGLD